MAQRTASTVRAAEKRASRRWAGHPAPAAAAHASASTTMPG
jgi:hypothetical protein